MTDEDRIRLHQLLDYAIDNDEDYAILQYARMDLNYHIHRTIYRMNIKKEEEDEERNGTGH